MKHILPFMMGALFALLIQQGIIIYFDLTRDDVPNQVIMSTYVVRDGEVQIFGQDAMVTVEECESFRNRVHNPPTQDGDRDWAVTVCEIIDPGKLNVNQARTNQEPAGGEVPVPGPQEDNQ